MKRLFSLFSKCQSGAGAIEYGLLALVGASVIGATTETGQGIANNMMRATIAIATGGDMSPLSEEHGNGGLEAEAPTNAAGEASWQGAAQIEGWSSTNGIEVWASGFLGLTAVDGETFVELDGGAGAVADAYSTDVPTIAGQPYTFTFSAAQRGGRQETVVVSYDGEVIGEIIPDTNTWQEFSFDVVGTGSANTRFTFSELDSQNDGLGVLLDGVSVSEGT